MTRAVEVSRGERQLAQLLAHRTFMQSEIVAAQRACVAVEKISDRVCRELAVLERARDALTHQRIDAGRVARQNDAFANVAVGGVEPSNGERMPSRRAMCQAIEWKFGKGGGEFRDHSRFFALFFFHSARPLIVDSHI